MPSVHGGYYRVAEKDFGKARGEKLNKGTGSTLSRICPDYVGITQPKFYDSHQLSCFSCSIFLTESMTSRLMFLISFSLRSRNSMALSSIL